MRLWFGQTRMPGAISFRWPTLYRGGSPWSTTLRVHPIRRLFGIAIGNTVICVARCDKAKYEQVKHDALEDPRHG